MKKLTESTQLINFILSFDYELGWGAFDKASVNYLTKNVMNSNEAASRLLRINEQMGVPATWAIVGLMLPSDYDREGKLELLDSRFPKCVRASDFFSNFDEQAVASLLEVPAGLFARIKDSPSQEFASHTFSHLYALEVGHNEVRNDFKCMAEICSRNDLGHPRSLVMPKNQTTDSVLTCAAEHGIKITRVNPNNWLYATRKRGRIESGITRLFRYLDAFLPVSELFRTKSHTPSMACTEGNFFFRPSIGTCVLDYAHYLRFKFMVYVCTLRRRDIHMWSHPHNFGGDMEQSLRNYVRILQYVLKLKAARKIDIKNMEQLLAD